MIVIPYENELYIGGKAMSFGERLRENAYWFLDRLKGSKVRKHYDDVLKCYDEGISDAEVQKKLDRLFRHAIDTCPYYAFLKDKENVSLSDFPLMNKMKYIENFEQVKSDVYRDAKDNKTMKTSGSTGIPFAVIQNKDKVNRNTAVSLVLNEKGGYRLGDKWASSRVWANSNKKSGMSKLMENIITIDASVLDEKWFDQIYDAIVNKKAKSLTMYPASMSILSNYIETKKVDLSKSELRGVFTISEAPNEYDKEKLSKLLGCPVNAFYSSQENGNMSLQDGGEEYRYDTSTWYVEILKFDSDEPAEEGEVGRIVVTDLYNYAFPMIRYDNGDVACYYKRKVEGTDRYKLWLAKVYGRRTDMVFAKDGTPVSFNILTVKMRGIENLIQWQFIQLDEAKYKFLLNSNGPVDTDEIKRRYADICGDDIEFEYVDEIPVMASGKRKLVENRMNKK